MSFHGKNDSTFMDGNGDPGGSQAHRGSRPVQNNSSGIRSRSNSRGSTTGILLGKNPNVIQNQNPSTHANAPTNNFYSTLQNNVFEHEIIRTDVQTEVTSKQSKTKAPPITVLNIPILELSRKIKNIHPHGDIKYKLTQFGIRMLIDDVEVFKKVRSYLINQKINFFSHPLKEERLKKFTLYGLPDMDNESVKQLLYEHDIGPVSVAKLNIKKKRYNDQSIYLIYYSLTSNMTIEKLRTVRYMDHVVVKFEEYSINKTGVTQCANCLHFSHGAKNCHLPPRCVKCGKDHASKDCDKKISSDPDSKIPNELVRCANCKGPHTANYSKCPSRAKYLQIRELARNNKHVRPSNRNQGHIAFQRRSYDNRQPSQQMSYANIVANSSFNDQLFSPTECYQIFKKFMNEISRCKSKSEQLDVIARLSFEYLSNNGRP